MQYDKHPERRFTGVPPRNSGSYAPVVKITPSNQTLILASERRGPAAPSAALVARTATPSGRALQRVTIAASQTDTVVYLRANYGSGASSSSTHASAARAPGGRRLAALVDASAGQDPTVEDAAARTVSAAPGGFSTSSALVSQPRTYGSPRDGYGNALYSSRDAGISSYLPPVEQYARTQRLMADTAPPQFIDAFA